MPHSVGTRIRVTAGGLKSASAAAGMEGVITKIYPGCNFIYDVELDKEIDFDYPSIHDKPRRNWYATEANVEAIVKKSALDDFVAVTAARGDNVLTIEPVMPKYVVAVEKFIESGKAYDLLHAITAICTEHVAKIEIPSKINYPASMTEPMPCGEIVLPSSDPSESFESFESKSTRRPKNTELIKAVRKLGAGNSFLWPIDDGHTVKSVRDCAHQALYKKGKKTRKTIRVKELTPDMVHIERFT